MDEELVALLAAGEERGMELLLATYAPLMRYIAAPILSAPEEIEECVSDAAMRVWERIGQFDRRRGEFRTWLTAITRNAAIDRSRAAARRPETVALETQADASVPAAEEELVRRERAAELRGALAELSAADRMLFYRKYYYLQPSAQIAAELGMSERAVEGRLYRLKKKLKKALGGQNDA
ncbi:MAG: sigma-70 family RNA polymerase sigma factor [Clostridia bacterium]|nr:sigma-70 family RNA polymerase sigma factor [Clostridia bacterium]